MIFTQDFTAVTLVWKVSILVHNIAYYNKIIFCQNLIFYIIINSKIKSWLLGSIAMIVLFATADKCIELCSVLKILFSSKPLFFYLTKSSHNVKMYTLYHLVLCQYKNLG